MRVKLPLKDLNHDPFSLYPISTYTCRVTTEPKVCDDICYKRVKCINLKHNTILLL